MRDFNALFPAADSDYRGTALSFWFLVALTMPTTARSLVHMFLPDGGTSVIAGLDTSVAGGEILIVQFGQWGLEQLLLSLVVWMVILRYRHLVPFVLIQLRVDPSSLASRFGIPSHPAEPGFPSA